MKKNIIPKLNSTSFGSSEIPHPVPILLTVSETSSLIRVSPKTIYRWVYEGKIPHVKLFGKLLFDRSEIVGLIQAHSVKNDFEKGHSAGNLIEQSSERHSRKGSLI